MILKDSLPYRVLDPSRSWNAPVHRGNSSGNGSRALGAGAILQWQLLQVGLVAFLRLFGYLNGLGAAGCDCYWPMRPSIRSRSRSA